MQIKFLHEDRPEVLPGDISYWPIHIVEGIPAQDNGNDCGIFVMKFMQASLVKEQVDWESNKSWPKYMHRFRAEIVVELFQTFHNSLLKEHGLAVL